jgi:ribosomal protein L30E
MDVSLNRKSQKNYNLGYNMTISKARLSNTKYLITLSRNARGETQEKVNNIIKLYSDSKISQLQSAENMILDLILSKNIRQQKATAKI